MIALNARSDGQSSPRIDRTKVTRYRPRGVRREGYVWDDWWPNHGRSAELHAAGCAGARPMPSYVTAW